LLRELAVQPDSGRIYRRDLPELGDELAVVCTAYRIRR
jgi:hypothetical protein